MRRHLRPKRKELLAYYIRLTVLQFCLELKSLNFNAFQQTRLADLLCSNERSSESPVLKLTVHYCRGHIKRKTLHDL